MAAGDPLSDAGQPELPLDAEPVAEPVTEPDAAPGVDCDAVAVQAAKTPDPSSTEAPEPTP